MILVSWDSVICRKRVDSSARRMAHDGVASCGERICLSWNTLHDHRLDAVEFSISSTVISVVLVSVLVERQRLL